MLQAFDERNRDLIVSVGGKLTHRDRAGVSPFDSAVQGGDAVWEGLRLHDGKVFRLDAHLARLRASARALAFSAIPPDAEIIDEIRRTVSANGMRDGVHIRLTLTRGVKVTSGMDPRLNTAGPTLIVLAEFKDPVYDEAGITLITASVRRPAPDCLDPSLPSHCSAIPAASGSGRPRPRAWSAHSRAVPPAAAATRNHRRKPARTRHTTRPHAAAQPRRLRHRVPPIAPRPGRPAPVQ